MNLLPNSPQNERELLFANFNQDSSCISVGTCTGYKIYTCEPFSEVFSSDEGGIGIAEMLFSSSLVALVGAGYQPNLSARKLRIVNTQTKQLICELNFVTAILAVKMNKKRVIVVMETKIHIYDLETMKILHTINTNANPKGLCCLSTGDNCLLVYPNCCSVNDQENLTNDLNPDNDIPSNTGIADTETGSPGDVIVFDALKLQPVNIVQAHTSLIEVIALNNDSSLLATASEKGTIIRVFSLRSATKSFAFRRGSYAAQISSIAFNQDSSLLAVSSNTGTIHLFKMDINGGAQGEGWGSYFPQLINEMWEISRDFAFITLGDGPQNNVKNVLSLCAFTQTNEVMVLADDGTFYMYRVNMHEGGECNLIQSQSIKKPNPNFFLE